MTMSSGLSSETMRPSGQNFVKVRRDEKILSLGFRSSESMRES